MDYSAKLQTIIKNNMDELKTSDIYKVIDSTSDTLKNITGINNFPNFKKYTDKLNDIDTQVLIDEYRGKIYLTGYDLCGFRNIGDVTNQFIKYYINLIEDLINTLSKYGTNLDGADIDSFNETKVLLTDFTNNLIMEKFVNPLNFNMIPKIKTCGRDLMEFESVDSFCLIMEDVWNIVFYTRLNCDDFDRNFEKLAEACSIEIGDMLYNISESSFYETIYAGFYLYAQTMDTYMFSKTSGNIKTVLDKLGRCNSDFSKKEILCDTIVKGLNKFLEQDKKLISDRLKNKPVVEPKSVKDQFKDMIGAEDIRDGVVIRTVESVKTPKRIVPYNPTTNDIHKASFGEATKGVKDEFIERSVSFMGDIFIEESDLTEPELEIYNMVITNNYPTSNEVGIYPILNNHYRSVRHQIVYKSIQEAYWSGLEPIIIEQIIRKYNNRYQGDNQSYYKLAGIAEIRLLFLLKFIDEDTYKYYLRKVIKLDVFKTFTELLEHFNVKFMNRGSQVKGLVTQAINLSPNKLCIMEGVQGRRLKYNSAYIRPSLPWSLDIFKDRAKTFSYYRAVIDINKGCGMLRFMDVVRDIFLYHGFTKGFPREILPTPDVDKQVSIYKSNVKMMLGYVNDVISYRIDWDTFITIWKGYLNRLDNLITDQSELIPKQPREVLINTLLKVRADTDVKALLNTMRFDLSFLVSPNIYRKIPLLKNGDENKIKFNASLVTGIILDKWDKEFKSDEDLVEKISSLYASYNNQISEE